MQNVRNLIANMTPKGRLMMVGSIAAVVLLVFFMMRIAGSPSYSTVMAGIDPAQTGKITAALDAKGIKYEIQNNGTALAVEKSQIDGVGGATVQLVLPQDQLFDDQQSAAKAAVLLSGGSNSIQPGAVRGIAQMVSGSVKG